MAAQQAWAHFNKVRASSEGKDSTIAKNKATLGLSKSVFEKLLVMCNLGHGEEDEIPEIWKILAEEGNGGDDKKGKIRRYIEETYWYSEAKVVPFAPLVNMVYKRKFEGEVSRSSLRSATKGLTPFAMPPLSDAEFDRINEASQALEVATQTTVKDVTSNRFEAEAPSSFNALTIWIKKFNNLIFALFGENCSLFSELGEIVTYLDDYGDEAIRNTTKRTLATILWIIHLQARHFSAGKMTGPKKLLPVFTLMSNAVQTKQPVVYGEVPRKLYEEQEDPAASHSNTRKRAGRPQEQEFRKKLKLNTNTNYHPLIKAKMDAVRNTVGRALCEAAGTDQFQLFPSKKSLCIKSTLFGQCFEGCTRDHSRVSNEEATKALELLKPATDDPTKIKVNKF